MGYRALVSLEILEEIIFYGEFCQKSWVWKRSRHSDHGGAVRFVFRKFFDSFSVIFSVSFWNKNSEIIIAQNVRISSALAVLEEVQWAAIIQNIPQKWKELQFRHHLATLLILQSE